MNIRRLIRKTFAVGNVCVTGLRGTGKDMLFGNVIARRRHEYVSNIDYGCKHSNFVPLDFQKLDCCNDYNDLIRSTVKRYDYPYSEQSDIYVSDVGVYMPSQYCNQLNRDYGYVATFMALSRHLGDCNFHMNVQNLNRAYDKLREQSDIYIRCEKCHVDKLGFVHQVITVYDVYDACLHRVEPFEPLRAGLFANMERRAMFAVKNEELLRSFNERNGSVRRYHLLYYNKSKYNTRYFKELFENA